MRLDLRDLLTGLVVAGLMLPEGVAYGRLAGLPPGRALAAGIAGGLAYAVVGRSRFAVVSPTSSSAAIIAAAISGLATNELAIGVDHGAIATMLVLLVGVIFVGLSAFRLGNLSDFISRPVLHGFTLGLAITIMVKQLPALLGVAVGTGSMWNVVASGIGALARMNPASAILGGFALSAILASRRTPQIPGVLLVLTGGTVLGFTAVPERWHVALAGPFTPMPSSLALPPLALLPRLCQLAAPIALILFAESWGTMRSLALKHGDRLNANLELRALGIANLAAGLAQGMPVGAGFSAGSANEAAGATSRIAAAAASVALLMLALFAGRWIARVPEPVLAAVVIAALTHALSPAPLIRLFRIRRDAWIAVAATLGVLAFGVLNGMLTAIALSVAHLLYTLSHPSISTLGRWGETTDFVDVARHSDAHGPAGVAIFRPNAPLIFANAESTLRTIEGRARASEAARVVISLEESNDLDSTAIDALAEFARSLGAAGKSVILARCHDRVRDVLEAAGLGDLAARSTFSVADAVLHAQTASEED